MPANEITRTAETEFEETNGDGRHGASRSEMDGFNLPIPCPDESGQVAPVRNDMRVAAAAQASIR
jgi:hypothetical protein